MAHLCAYSLSTEIDTVTQHHLTRAAFSRSRLAEFASVKELTTQTGHGPEDWPLVIVKELVDNGIDAAETAGVPPVIRIVVTGNNISVTDNSGGVVVFRSGRAELTSFQTFAPKVPRVRIRATPILIGVVMPPFLVTRAVGKF